MKVDIDAPYRTRIRQALADTDVRTALERAMSQLAERRERAVEAVDDERMRTDARAAREDAIRRLPSLLEELERTLTENGSVVHWARDAAEANRIVVEIARARGVESVVKSKSMATEEILIGGTEGSGSGGRCILARRTDHPADRQRDCAKQSRQQNRQRSLGSVRSQGSWQRDRERSQQQQ